MRDVHTTAAYEVPRGAELVGGAEDGLRIEHVHVLIDPPAAAEVLLILADGSEYRLRSQQQVSWLPPARAAA